MRISDWSSDVCSSDLTFGHLSALIVLSRERASQGFYPAVDPLRSESKMLTPPLVGERHYRVARTVRETRASYDELKDVIAILGMAELSREDQSGIPRARRLEGLLTPGGEEHGV